MSFMHHASTVMAKPAAPPLAATIAPASWVTSYPNSTQSQVFEAFPTGGAPGYSYSWDFSIPGAGVSITSGTTSKTVTVQASGTDEFRVAELRCTVTDAASGNAQPVAEINLSFGTPP